VNRRPQSILDEPYTVRKEFTKVIEEHTINQNPAHVSHIYIVSYYSKITYPDIHTPITDAQLNDPSQFQEKLRRI
jgi:hypothetical protein